MARGNILGKTRQTPNSLAIVSRPSFLKNLKLDHSIAHAFNTDAQAIAELTGPKGQAQEDKPFTI